MCIKVYYILPSVMQITPLSVCNMEYLSGRRTHGHFTSETHALSSDLKRYLRWPVSQAAYRVTFLGHSLELRSLVQGVVSSPPT